MNGNSGAIFGGGMNNGNQAWLRYRHCKKNPDNEGECSYRSNAVGRYGYIGREGESEDEVYDDY